MVVVAIWVVIVKLDIIDRVLRVVGPLVAILGKVVKVEKYDKDKEGACYQGQASRESCGVKISIEQSLVGNFYSTHSYILR